MTTRFVLAGLALLLLVAVPASAKPDLPDPRGDQVEIGPCVAGWSLYWPGESAGARCTVKGTTVAASHGTCALGRYTYLEAGRLIVFIPCNGWE